ncbi:hypothetical protein [Fusibacter ferrireducens]|uniref:DUF4352 domain-containing protein n=1 Tax=Fusibacter ferrireducens TaxID=2785058 RepID=A0ABR9ZPX1_9FIRM|nr:hypothetical protein [Fusibacter ferrireducens]MBF4692489.1 hypothetical protein [Fusibacter ferrireducens]
MDRGKMSKKATIIFLVITIIAALGLGFLLINKGDGPIAGMVLADREIDSIENYVDATKAQGKGIYSVVSNAFNKFEEDYHVDIPEGKDLYVIIHFVECPKGSKYTGKWIKDGEEILKSNGILSTGPEGVISYKLEGKSVTKGQYLFELYDGNSKLIEKAFSLE